MLKHNIGDTVHPTLCHPVGVTNPRECVGKKKKKNQEEKQQENIGVI